MRSWQRTRTTAARSAWSSRASANAATSEVQALKDKGVEFAGEVSEHPWGRIATFKDPDSNDLQLYAAAA